MKPATASTARRMNTDVTRRAREPRTCASQQYDAGAMPPIPHEDAQHERENAFID
jgi:hypothetical protein